MTMATDTPQFSLYGYAYGQMDVLTIKNLDFVNNFMTMTMTPGRRPNRQKNFVYGMWNMDCCMMVMGWIDQVMDRDFILTVDTSHFQPSNIGGTYLFGLILKLILKFMIGYPLRAQFKMNLKSNY